MGKTQGIKRLCRANWKHPHARGEDCHTTARSSPSPETSPRPWGRLRYKSGVYAPDGNIPSPVGKTSMYLTPFGGPGKHPLARGEDPAQSRLHIRDKETSPRPWGRQSKNNCMIMRPRNIPTPVGKTEPRRSDRRRLKKHPHACGEDFVLSRPSICSTETSPRLWGRLKSGIS